MCTALRGPDLDSQHPQPPTTLGPEDSTPDLHGKIKNNEIILKTPFIRCLTGMPHVYVYNL